MIRIYCQQTIGGFKIFNLSTFKHKSGDFTYALVSEINDAKNAKTQEILVTNSFHNGLDSYIINQFSSGAASMMILGDCGPNRKETTLFVSPIDSKLKFAFVTDDKDGLKLFTAMASMWLSKSGRAKLSRLLTGLISEPIIENKQTLALNLGKWEDLKHLLSGVAIQPKLLLIEKGEKGFLVYNTPKKEKILKDAGIDKPFSYFISMPGNEELRKAERNKKIAYIGIGIGCCIAVASLVFWALKSHNQSSVEIEERYRLDESLDQSFQHTVVQNTQNENEASSCKVQESTISAQGEGLPQISNDADGNLYANNTETEVNAEQQN